MKKITNLVLLVGLVTCVCTPFPSVYQDIQFDTFRTIAIKVDPADAAPGDTVRVKWYGSFPDTSHTVHWTLTLDYAPDLDGEGSSRGHVIDLDSVTENYSDTSFSFVLPDSTLLYSSELASKVSRLPGNTGDSAKSVPQLNAMIQALIAAHDTILTSADSTLVDNFRCTVKLNMHVREQTDSGNAFQDLDVRYSSKFHTMNVNINPVIRWIGVIKLRKDQLNPDSIGTLTDQDTVRYLYNPLQKDSVKDTILVDTGYSYFLFADSTDDSSLQTYSYDSLTKDFKDTVVTAIEKLNYQWFYTNLDTIPNVIEDSLIMFGSSLDRPVISLMPPVDTAMHDFKIYAVVRDSRVDNEIKGVDEKDVTGYFRYSAAYATNHPRTQGGRGIVVR